MENGESSYRRYLDGDQCAFDEVLKTYRSGLTLFINRYVQNMDAAEDLAIDTFMYLIVHPHHYNFKTSLKTYLFMIGRSRALDYLRHQKIAKNVELTEVDAQWEPSTEESMLMDEQKQALNRALCQLPQPMQMAVHLVYFEDLSYEDAAKVMKKNRKQIANLLYRAKVELRSILGKEGAFL